MASLINTLSQTRIASLACIPSRQETPHSSSIIHSLQLSSSRTANLRCRASEGSRCSGTRTEVQKDSEASPEEVKTTLSQSFAKAAVATVVASLAMLSGVDASLADLNRFEAGTRGEFGIGSAAQYGSADLRKTVHSNENFRRANFTSADMREADFSGSVFVGGYLEKAVAYRTDFTAADFTDALMDRMVLNEANLTDAILVRVVLTRSDLGDAIITGADFSDAILDLSQKQALCKNAKGVNSVTGMDTRQSLGCGNRRGNAYGTPSAPALSGPSEKFLDKNGFCDDSSGLCGMTVK